MTIGVHSSSALSPYESELARRVEGQAMACIGCNDCLLACPIQEARSVTIGELNHALHLPVLKQPNVIAFVTACTQCAQCVPACPADLNRAEMVLFNKLKVEDSVPDHELLLQARTVTFPSGWTLDALAGRLAEIELFHGASAPALRRLLLKSTLRLLVPGEELCREGEFHERLSVVLSGALTQVTSAPHGGVLPILTLGPGCFLGEMAVLGDAPEPFGVVAAEKSIVLEAPKATVLRLMDQAPPVRSTLDALYARRALFTYAKSPGALGVLPDAAIEELFSDAELVPCPPGFSVFSAGAPPRDFYIVRSGFLRATQSDGVSDRVLTYFREGSMFGAFALLQREPAHTFGVDAATRAELIRISGAALGRVLARHPYAHHALAHAAFEAERLARARDVGFVPMAPSFAPSRTSLTERSMPGEHVSLEASVLVERGIASGREVLVIDQTRCTSCGNCIDACERRHGASRLQLRGIQAGQYMFPSACRHCADPACLLCSVNGIARLPSGEIQIVTENCIGCGACAQRCPYGNISMHAVQPPKRGFLPTLRDFLAGSSRRDEALAALDPKISRVAVKCDLCAGHDDYACVTACPTAAAFRIDPAAVLGDRHG
jgi:Fe-S-cluster-containing hydrogenase component 2/CRP-like cAMP-binding protein